MPRKRKTKEVPRFQWENREADLQKVIRYHECKVMFYRTEHLLHSRRVPAILRELLPGVLEVCPDFNIDLALAISKYHDDHEMISGDIPLQRKLMMNATEQMKQKADEIAAASYLAECYGNPRIGEYKYLDLLMHAILKDCPEAQVHSFADKIEAWSEALHEVLAGNMVFVEPLINYPHNIFGGDSLARFPLIREVFQDGSPFVMPVVKLKDFFNFGLKGASPHTPESVEKKTGASFYELWKRVTLSMPGGMERLTTQVEFYPPPEPRLTVVPPALKIVSNAVNEEIA